MGKRVGSTGISAAKKAKVTVNPVFAEIQGALKEAEHLPTNVRSMLAAMVPAAFITQLGDRSKEQASIIQWVEDALEQKKAKLVAQVDVVSSQQTELEAGKAKRMEELRQAEAVLAERKQGLMNRKTALAEATIGMKATSKSLSQKQEEQQTLDKDYITMKKEQEGLASAFVEYFKAPLESGEALHYAELEPFLRNLNLEESFMVSAPSSCMKTKEQRGSFDNVVLGALEEALLARASQIKDIVSNPSPESEAREVAIQKTEEQLAIDQAAQEKATADLASAQKDMELAAATLKEAEQVVANCDIEIKAITETCECHRALQEGFQNGPLASFRNSKDGTNADLCATAGA
jgi:hypothetical protein